MKRQRLPWLIIGFWMLAVLSSLWLKLDTTTVNLQGLFATPAEGALLGRDDLGRPLLERLLSGMQISLLVAGVVTLVTAVAGICIGCLAAWYGGALDHMLSRIIDSFMAFPGLLLAIALAGLLGPGIDNLVMALSLVGWVGFARLSRAQMFSLKHREHVLAARSVGVGGLRIVARHLLPLMAAPLIVEATFTLAGVIIAEAGLSFLGIGIQPPAASLGNMIRDGSRYLLVAPHMVLVPGVALASLVYAINAIGDQLRDSLDSRLILRSRS